VDPAAEVTAGAVPVAGIEKLIPALGNHPATVSVVAVLLVTSPLTAPAVTVLPIYPLTGMFRLPSKAVVAVNVVAFVPEAMAAAGVPQK
jgi:hypothetical protein